MYCIQAIEKRVRVLKNVHFDHWLCVLCLGSENSNKVIVKNCKYQNLLERERPRAKTVKIWNEETIKCIQGCFDGKLLTLQIFELWFQIIYMFVWSLLYPQKHIQYLLIISHGYEGN